MLRLTFDGKVTTTPELKTSAKGMQYLKFIVEHATPNGRWADRIYVTMFGEDAIAAARVITTPGFIVEITGKPETRAYLDKMNQPRSVLECIGRTWRVLEAPQTYQQQGDGWRPPGEKLADVLLQSAPSSIDEDSIPF